MKILDKYYPPDFNVLLEDKRCIYVASKLVKSVILFRQKAADPDLHSFLKSSMYPFYYTRFFFFRKMGTLVSYQSRPVVRPSVTFLVNVSPPRHSNVTLCGCIGDMM